jgi:predicted lipase
MFIRGTASFTNLITGISYASEDLGSGLGACSACKVHGGFWRAYRKLKVKLFASFERIMSELQDKDKIKVDHVIFTGHSLGGAMANLATLTYFNSKNSIKIQKI